MNHELSIRKKISIFAFVFVFLLITTYSLLTAKAYAVCPVCTIAVGAGLGISRALGIDDAVTSVWVGGLVLSMSFWFIDWLKKRIKNYELSKAWPTSSVRIKNKEIFVFLLMYALVLLPLWYGKYIGRINNQILGVDKILFGTAIGTLAFLLGKWLDAKVREKKGKQLFIYQKVVFPVASLIIASVALHFLIS